jgi:hypothetical protein
VILIGKEYVKFESEIRAAVYGVWTFERVLGFKLRDGFVVFGSVKVKRLELTISSPTQSRVSAGAVLPVEEPQLIAKL